MTNIYIDIFILHNFSTLAQPGRFPWSLGNRKSGTESHM